MSDSGAMVHLHCTSTVSGDDLVKIWPFMQIFTISDMHHYHKYLWR